jgi:hypothetical protein
MKPLIFTFTFAAFLGSTLATVRVGAQGDSAATPKFVFTGKIKELRASNEPSVKASDRTVIVTVEEVHPPAPAILARYKGQDVTVKTNKPLADSPLQVGQQAVFSTQGLVYGKGLVVVEVLDRRLIGGAEANADEVQKKHDHAIAEVKKQSDAAIQAHAATVDASVIGTVEEVRPISHERIVSAFAKVAPKKVFPREHDAKWHEAVVRVDSGEGLAKDQKHVVVVFPESEDIAWRHAPKFRKDQKGKFQLHKRQIKNQAMRMALLNTPSADNPVDAQSYTALDPQDFVPTP